MFIGFARPRIAKALAAVRPHIRFTSSSTTRRAHRCDLVQLWCQALRIPIEASRMTLACDGVRHALQLVFSALAQNNIRVAIPSDVYPVYWQIARQAGLLTCSFDSFPTFDPEQIFSIADASAANVVLLPQPLKLHGRAWTDAEAGAAEDWLRRRSTRRLILDGVYGLGLPLDAVTERLIETDQVLFLDSLSKGWLHEQFSESRSCRRATSRYTSRCFAALLRRYRSWRRRTSCSADFSTSLGA